MASVNDAIVHALTISQGMLKRYVEDLTPQEYLHRPTPKANCAAWTVGHLTLVDRKILAAMGAPLPELADGYEHRFSQKEGCPEAGDFGDVRALVPLFDEHRNRLIAAVKRASAEQLDKPLEKPRPVFKTPGEAASFQAVHTAMHAG
jgi:hypothetical protein